MIAGKHSDLLFSEHSQTGFNYLMKQSYVAGELRPVVCLCIFRKTPGFYELGKGGNIVGQEDRIMDKLFMALIAIGSRLLLQVPFVFWKKRFTDILWTIGRSSEETLGYIMMFGRMRTAFHRRFGIVAAAMKRAATNCAMLR